MDEIELGKSITERRKQLRLNQSELAELAGINRGTLSALENGAGNRGATIATLVSVSKVLGLTITLSENRPR
jgi:transcriptional regulator with XRE-family HTH domain